MPTPCSRGRRFAKRGRTTDQSALSEFVIHEVARIFHYFRRRDAGHVQTRRRQWVLDIGPHERETFVSACEAYARNGVHG